MIGFSYQYLSQEEIFSHIARLSNMSFGDAILLLTCMGVFILFSIILIPSIIILLRHKKDQAEAYNKKKLLTQILLQKEIEDEVEREIQLDDQKK